MNIKKLALKSTAILAALVMVMPPLVTQAVVMDVSISDSSYSPQTITVQQGATIMWTNNGNMPHTVTADNNSFNSGTINPGGTFSYTFNTPGTFSYHCNFHQGMNGTVIVGSGDVNNEYQIQNYQNQNYNWQYHQNHMSSNHSISGSVVQSNPPPPYPPIIINNITPVKTAGVADGTFPNGWKWIFDVTVPQNEQNLAMKFSNWIHSNGQYIIPAANNIRFYSTQSSNASNQNSAIQITAPNTYSSTMMLSGDLDSSPLTRRIHITVESRIPPGSQLGTYSTNFSIRTQ